MRFDGDVNELLHEGRTAMLRLMPPGAQALLSAGCAGRWYFDWIERAYGAVPLHVGLEYYSPKPDDLPDNVRWIANTCSDMRDIDDASCDLVISGQNLEHLWPEEIEGFMVEAARVTRKGGSLVIDSPNRAITSQLGNWSHPEHIIEFTVDEARRLIELGGFDVQSIDGIWLNRTSDGRILPFIPDQAAEDWSVPERLILAKDRPDDSFIWWIVARRADRAPDVPALRALIDEVYSVAWPERIQRLSTIEGKLELHDGEEWYVGSDGLNGALLYGPYMPLRAGSYRATFRYRAAEATKGYFDIVIGNDPRILEQRELDLPQGEGAVSIDFVLDKLEFGCQFRGFARGGAKLDIQRRIVLEENCST